MRKKSIFNIHMYWCWLLKNNSDELQLWLAVWRFKIFSEVDIYLNEKRKEKGTCAMKSQFLWNGLRTKERDWVLVEASLVCSLIFIRQPGLMIPLLACHIPWCSWTRSTFEDKTLHTYHLGERFGLNVLLYLTQEFSVHFIGKDNR